MGDRLIYPFGYTDATRFATEILHQKKIPLVDHPTPEVTHLLLDVPSFRNDGLLRNGKRLDVLLSMLPPSITIIGGNLDHPALTEYATLDLLKMEEYLCPNAAITAECALAVVLPHLTTTLSCSPTLIIGWGRIGKYLAALLKQIGTEVTILIRNPKEKAFAHTMGYKTVGPEEQIRNPEALRILFNTAPDTVLTDAQLKQLKNCVKIDLASGNGFIGESAIPARGLPGKYTPETSGALIAQTILPYL